MQFKNEIVREGFQDCCKGIKECPYTEHEKSVDWDEGWDIAYEGGYSEYFIFNDGE